MGLLLLSALPLGGCATSIADMPIVGTPADAPARPKDTGAYLPVHDLPPDREEAEIIDIISAKIIEHDDGQLVAEKACGRPAGR